MKRPACAISMVGLLGACEGVLAPAPSTPDARIPGPADTAPDPDVGPHGGGVDASNGSAPLMAPWPIVFDGERLHEITITIPPAGVPAVESGQDARVPCTVVFDGITRPDTGIRQKGGQYNPYRPLGRKPSLSLKFDELVSGQTLVGLKRLILNSAYQDSGFVDEHLVYEVYRRAGLAGPLTAHAVVTVNGFVEGIYVIKEAIDKQFLRRNFGPEFDQGNLYEGFLPDNMSFGPDFVLAPDRLELKDEVEDGRTRDDIRALAAAVKDTPDERFADEVSKRLDLDQYLTAYAIDGVTGQRDDYNWNLNNHYLYDRPRDGRFLFIPHGSDQAFGVGFALHSAFYPRPLGRLAVRVGSIPTLAARYRAEVKRIGSEPIWNVPALLARVAQVATVLRTARPVGRVIEDLARFDRYRPVVDGFIKTRGLSRLGDMTLTSSVMGEGGTFPRDNTCSGTNQSPPLGWTPGPPGTRSYAMVLTDEYEGVVQWILRDIPAPVTALPAGADARYAGPCSGATAHQYKMAVWALAVDRLDVAAGASLAAILASARTNALATGALTATAMTE